MSTTTLDPRTRTLRIPPAATNALLTTAAAGAALFLLGLLVSPERVWGGYLMGFLYFVGLALAGPLFLAIVYLSGARWAWGLRRVPEAMAGALPAALVLGLVLITGTHALYEWSHADVVAADPLLAHKSSWLNLYGFSLRLVIYFAIWIWLARRLVQRSRDPVGEPVRTRRNITTSALTMAVFAVTFSLASFDWVMSLDPHWFSTIFALNTVSGVLCSGVALCTIVLVTLRRNGILRDIVTRDVMDDLGKILLALSLFWAYIWYCQYMIIWYSNLPEETGYYALRHEHGWESLGVVNLILNFAVPFLVLMLRMFRRNGVALRRIAIWILFGHLVDLYVMVGPALLESGPSVGIWELAPVVGALALFAWLLLNRLGRSPLVAEG